MKKIIALLAAAMLLFAAAASAENLQDMPDEELIAYWNLVRAEMESRGLLAGSVQMSAEKEAVLEKLRDFFCYWSANDLDNMLDYCSPAWKSMVENPKTALFAVLRNRTPLTLEPQSVEPGENDAARTVTVHCMMDRHNGKDPLKYLLRIRMVREDGAWYIDPRCLENDEAAATPAPAAEQPAETPEGIDGSTVLYYQPEGGSYYHLDPNCRRVNGKYLPLEGMFTYAEVNEEPYSSLKPCEICGAPQR